MIPLLLAWMAQADAGTLAEAEDAVWSNPQSAEARLAFAEALAATSERVEEGAEALRWLLYDRKEAPMAREVLGEIVRRHPPRPGWMGIYTELSRGPAGPARTAAKVRIAQLRLTDRNTTIKVRAWALTELESLSTAGDALATVALGDVLFEAGDATAARRAWLRAPVSVGAERAALAALAAGDVEEAERERQRAVEAGGDRADGLGASFDTAVATNSPVARAQALIEAGFPHAAERVLLAHLGTGGGTEAGTEGGTESGTESGTEDWTEVAPEERMAAAVAAVLGDLRLARGDGVGAASAYTDALVREETPANRARLVRALLASGRVDEAADAMEVGVLSTSDRVAMELTLVFARALTTASLDDDLPAGAAAFARAPDEIGTAATYGRLLLAAGRDAEAVAPLARALALQPRDADTRGMLLGAAVRALDVRALDAAANALAFAESEKARAEQLDALAGLLLASASAQKDAGSPATARTSALVALAVRPNTPAVLHAVAGALWEDGRREAALSLYTHAASLDLEDIDARVYAAQLSLSLGREDLVEAWLARLPRNHPKVRALRDSVAKENRAKAARSMKDPVAAEAAWKGLISKWPKDARFLHGLADLYQALDRREEALALQRSAVALNPFDPWNQFGLVQALLALDRDADAIEILDSMPEKQPYDVTHERNRIRARLAREAGDRAREANDMVAALRHYAASHALEADIWTSIALAGAQVAVGDPTSGLARFRAALSTHGSDVAVDTVASRGEAGALEALGQAHAALAVLDALAARRPEVDTERQREELRSRIAVGEADALRRAGRLAEAEKALQKMVLETGNQPLVQAAWAALLVDLKRPRDAVVAATRALQREPTNQWALDVARTAGRACRCSARVEPLFRVAIASGRTPELARGLQRVQVAAAIEAALAARARRQPTKVADAMRVATTLAIDDAPSLVILADGQRELGRPVRARRLLEQAHALEPGNIDAVVGLADDLVARGRLKPAIVLVENAWTVNPVARLGELLARLRASQPGPLGARKNGSGSQRGSQTGDAAMGDRLPRPVQPGDVQSGDGQSGDGQSGDGQSSVVQPKPPPDRRMLATAGFGVLRRSGVAGVGKEFVTFVPLHLGPPPVGQFQFDVEAVLVRVENGVDSSYGVAPSVGMTTPTERDWAAWARLGASPIGFEEGAYPVWHVGGRARIGMPFALGVETGRAPVLDSYASWVGVPDLFTREPFGRVHHTWFGGWAGVGAPWGTDAGLLGRLGQSQGIGLDPVGRAEIVAWLGQRIGTPENNVRIGGEGVTFSHQRQVDGFETGQGAFYSPPIFAVATGRIDVRLHGFQDRLGVCVGAGAGMQYTGGGTSLYFAPGNSFTHNGRFSVEWNVSGKWGVALQGGWLTAGTWHQETGMIRFGHNLGGAPPLTTFATPSAGLSYQGEPC